MWEPLWKIYCIFEECQSITMDYIFLYTESRTPNQNELNRLSQDGVTESCTTTSFSTCSVTPTKIVGALQTPSPSPPARTREAEGTEQPTPRVTPPIPMSTPPPSPPPPPPPPWKPGNGAVSQEVEACIFTTFSWQACKSLVLLWGLQANWAL